jgi:CYTH domain-containing protein
MFEGGAVRTKLEAERRFILKRKPKSPAQEVIDMLQYYITMEHRIRRTKNGDDVRYWQIKKKPIDKDTHVKDVQFAEITQDRFKELMSNAKRLVKKTRHIYFDETGKWEIDVFHDMRIVIAEIEMPIGDDGKLTKESQDISHVPSFLTNNIIMEVTDIESFSSHSLSEEI